MGSLSCILGWVKFFQSYLVNILFVNTSVRETLAVLIAKSLELGGELSWPKIKPAVRPDCVRDCANPLVRRHTNLAVPGVFFDKTRAITGQTDVSGEFCVVLRRHCVG